MEHKKGFYEKYIKRPQDFLCALLACIVLSPVLLVIAILVKIKIGSPVLFSQERPGLHGDIFKIYKFRTMTNERDENGELVYGESHILCNLFSVKAIEEISKNKLPYHSAFKKAKYLDKEGNLVTSDKPNAYKFEAFLFDAFETLDDIAILRVKREEEFAPVKNAEGVDSPDTARKLYKEFHKIK